MSVSNTENAGFDVQFSEKQQVGLRAFLSSYNKHYEFITGWAERYCETIPSIASIIRATPKAEMQSENTRSRALMRAAILEGEWNALVGHLRSQGEQYAKLGVAFGDWFKLVGGMREELVPKIEADHRDAPATVIPAILGMDTYLDVAMATIGDSYLRTKESIIGEQQNAIREMSTPVLKLRDRLLLLPIVGLIDTWRARLLTETLLIAIREHRARVVVIDITGVAFVDTKVANHLFQTVAAARLMGARSIVTGISSGIAQSIVMLGVDLSSLATVGDLQSGLEEAERLMVNFEIGAQSSPRPRQ